MAEDSALAIYFAVFVADEAGPVDPDNGTCSTCVALFSDVEHAIKEARSRLAEGYSVSIETGAMTNAEWNALEEVPDDFAFPGTPSPRV